MQIRSARHGSGAWAWLLTCAHVCGEKALARLALRSASLRATALPFAATRTPCTPPWVACDLRCKDQGANRSAIGRARHSRARGRGALFARLDGAARQAQAQIHRQPSAAHSLKCAHRAGGDSARRNSVGTAPQELTRAVDLRQWRRCVPLTPDAPLHPTPRFRPLPPCSMHPGDARSQELKRKRDKKKEQDTARAVRMKQYRLLLKAQAQCMTKPSGCLREPPRADGTLLVKHSGGGARFVKWAPSKGSVVEVDCSAGKTQELSCARTHAPPSQPAPAPAPSTLLALTPAAVPHPICAHTPPSPAPQAGSSSVCTLTRCQQCSRGWRRR